MNTPLMLRVYEPALGLLEAEALRQCVFAGDASGNSPTVRAFETAFARVVGAEYALAVSSGTTALHLAVEGLGIGPGTTSSFLRSLTHPAQIWLA